MSGATKETYSLSGCSPEVCAEPGEAEKAPEGRKGDMGDMGMGRNWVSNEHKKRSKIPMNPWCFSGMICKCWMFIGTG